MIYSIYKITNTLNNQCYIGYTNNWKLRKRQHKRYSNPQLHKAFNQYGVDNFTFDIIYQSKDKNYCLNTMEPHFIKEYDSIQNGYNTAIGGLSHNDKPFELKTTDYLKLTQLFSIQN
jgi:group I intron endonuclease